MTIRSVRRPVWASYLLLSILVAACEAGDRSPRASSGEAAPIMAHNDGSGAWGPGEEWRVVEELRVGAVAGAGPTVFGDVSDVDVDSAGRLYVLDRLAREVRIFASDGTHVRSFGEVGEGPGEFTRPTGLVLLPGGRLWVADVGGGRYSVFDTTGAYMNSYSAEHALQAMPWLGGFLKSGRFVETGIHIRPDGSFEPTLVRYAVEGDLTEVARTPRPVPEHEGIKFEGGAEMGTPFGPWWEWHLDPRGYIWVGWNAEYRIAQVSLDGDTIRVLTKDHEPEPVSPEDAAGVFEWLGPRLDRRGHPREGVLPSVRPAYETFMTDEQGYLWVGLSLFEDELRSPGHPARYDIFDPSGVYLGEITAPVGLWASLPKPVIRGNYLAGVVTDDLGVDYVVRARIVR